MRVSFDFQTFALQEYGGISRYFCRLASHLQSYSDVSAKIIAPMHINFYLSELDPKLVYGKRIQRIPKTGRLLRATSNFLSIWPMNRFHPDIVHQTYYSSHAYAPRSSYRVVTVFDMIHERFPSLFSNRDRPTEAKRAAVQRADRVICISEHTRRDLLDIFGTQEDKVSVIYLGFDRLGAIARQSSITSRSLNSKPYILYVGYRGGHKNFSGVLKAFASSSRMRNDFRLMCFGGGDFQSQEVEQFRELGLKEEQLIQIGGSDAKLGSCYRNAAIFVYPSLYEGFGIPPLEAMSADCPVVCSDTSSIPEVVGDAGEYFDPNHTESIRLALERVLYSPTRQTELVANGRRRCTRFSWQQMTEETLSIYRGLA